MKAYIITLQLVYQENTYVNLITYLKSSFVWARPMANVWIIKTPKDATEIRNGINTRINLGLGDRVLVMNVQSFDWATNNIDKIVTDWMKNI